MKKVDLEIIRGDGGRVRISPEEMESIHTELKDLAALTSDAQHAVRRDFEDVLYCRWDGQSDDGRKRRSKLGQEALPFEGASDNRIRMADMLVNEHTMEKLAAATRAIPKFTGMESGDEVFAGKLSTLVRYLINGPWRRSWRPTLRLLSRFQEADQPALAFCYCDWARERALEIRTIKPLDLVDLYVERAKEHGTEVNPEQAQAIVDLCSFPEMQDQLTQFLLTLAPQLSEARARKSARELTEKGETIFPMPYLLQDAPRIEAMRAYMDVFLPPNVEDVQRSPYVYVSRWITKAEVMEAAGTQGWNREFVTQLIGDEKAYISGHEGKDAWTGAETDHRVIEFTSETEMHKGLYQVLYRYARRVNDEGVIGIYLTVMSGFIDVPALAIPFDRWHGGYPLVAVTRESLTKRMMDSRSVVDLCRTDQSSRKLLCDSFEDHVQVATLPPIRRPAGKSHYTIDISPLGTVESTPRDPTEFMKPPDYPAAADKYWDKRALDFAEYWGRAHPAVSEELQRLHSQDRVDTFLDAVSQVMVMGTQLMFQFAPDVCQRVVGGKGIELPKTRREVQRMYDAALAFDIGNLNLEYVKGKAEVMLKYIRPLDARGRIRYDELAARLLQSVDANIAETAIVSIDTADRQEEDEEKGAFISMLNGVRAPMPEGGINATLRLQVLEAEMAPRMQNPGAYPPISAASAALIQERMDYLEFQGQQVQNAETGRIGVDTGKTDAAIQKSGVRSQESESGLPGQGGAA